MKNALDRVICICMNEPGLEFVWVGDDAVDPLEHAQTLQILVGAGIKTREEPPSWRWDRPPIPAIPGLRTKGEHFLDRLRRSWHSHLQWKK
jgi:hypothetical protein